jgi:hypothetical protein
VTDLAMTFDATAPRALAEFWRRALGYEEAPPPEGWDTWEAWLTDHDVPRDHLDHVVMEDPEGNVFCVV